MPSSDQKWTLRITSKGEMMCPMEKVFRGLPQSLHATHATDVVTCSNTLTSPTHHVGYVDSFELV